MFFRSLQWSCSTKSLLDIRSSATWWLVNNIFLEVVEFIKDKREIDGDGDGDEINNTYSNNNFSLISPNRRQQNFFLVAAAHNKRIKLNLRGIEFNANQVFSWVQFSWYQIAHLCSGERRERERGQVKTKIMRAVRVVRIILCERADALLLTIWIACSVFYGRVCIEQTQL